MATRGRSGAPYAGWAPGILPIPQPDDAVLVEYVYPDCTLTDIHSKTRTLDFEPKVVTDVPVWDTLCYNYFLGPQRKVTDERLEMYVHPRAMYRDPFRRGKNKIVLCDFMLASGEPAVINTRFSCNETMEKIADQVPWYGIEQEYFILDEEGWPLNWKKHPDYVPIDFHSMVGPGKTVGLERDLVDVHYQACLYAGLKLFGTNREDAPGQWEYQIGPSEGISAGDEVIISRYLLLRVAEMFGVGISFDPKPVLNCCACSGAHINFSTKNMREEGGMTHINDAIKKLASMPQEKILSKYDPFGGSENLKRLKGAHYVPGAEFTWGIGDKNVSVRIPTMVAERGKGYIEDRRPSSNMDPYQATEVLTKALLLGEV